MKSIIMDQQMPQNPPEMHTPPTAPSAQKATGLGWVWVAVIVIIVAGILYVTQKKAPSQSDANDEQAEGQVMPNVKDIPVTPSMANKPKSVPAGSIFGLDWSVAAAEQTFASETGIAWDTTSHKGAFGIGVAPANAGYPNVSTGHSGGYFGVPGDFEDNIKLATTDAEKALYLRVFATVAGKTYWSEEISIPIRAVGAMNGGS